MAVFGAVSLGALPTAFSVPLELGLFAVYVAALVLLLATDLDQRLLPDVITYSLVVLAAVAFLTGVNPLVRGETFGPIAAAIIFPLALYLPSIPFGAGAIGMGDLKLLVSVGLLLGLYRTFAGVVSGAVIAGLVLGVLLLTRRITLKTYVPFGPFLIAGTVWGIFVTVPK